MQVEEEPQNPGERPTRMHQSAHHANRQSRAQRYLKLTKKWSKTTQINATTGTKTEAESYAALSQDPKEERQDNSAERIDLVRLSEREINSRDLLSARVTGKQLAGETQGPQES